MDALALPPPVDGPIPQGLRLAFAVNFGFHEWYLAMIPYMQARASQYGASLEVLDAKVDPVTQQAQVERALEDGVDGIVIAPADERSLAETVAHAVRRGVRVVCESSLVPGAQRYVATCDYDMGRALGRHVGRTFARAAQEVHLLDVTYPPLASVQLRSEGFWDGLRESGARVHLAERVDGRAEVAASQEVTAQALARHPEINLVFGMDDESAVGAARAIQARGSGPWPAVVGCGFSGPLGRAALADPGHPYRVTGAMFPEYVGVRCIDACLTPLAGGPFPERWITPFAVVERADLPEWFDMGASVEAWRPRLERVARLPVPTRCTRGA